MLRLEGVEVAQRLGRIRRLGVQPDHRREERRLAPAEVIGPVAVRNVTDGLQEMCEVVEHVANEIRPSAFDEPQHREVRVPVVHFAKSSAGNDVGRWKRNQRRSGVRRVRRAGEHGPESANVLFHRLRRVGLEIPADGRWNLEVLLDERAQIEPGRLGRRRISCHDLRRRRPRAGIDKGL